MKPPYPVFQRQWLGAILCCLAAFAMQAVAAQGVAAQEVQQFTLNNGMTLIV